MLGSAASRPKSLVRPLLYLWFRYSMGAGFRRLASGDQEPSGDVDWSEVDMILRNQLFNWCSIAFVWFK